MSWTQAVKFDFTVKLEVFAAVLRDSVRYHYSLMFYRPNNQLTRKRFEYKGLNSIWSDNSDGT